MVKFETNNHNVITTPGKFRLQPRYAPYYWKQVLDGLHDDRTTDGFIFDITDKDVELFPELHIYDIVTISEENNLVIAEAGYE